MVISAIRTGKMRAQDAYVRWQEFRDRQDQRQQHANVRRQRFSCADSLKEYEQTQDWTGQMGMSPSGRFQVIEEKREREPLITREGLQWRLGWGILIAVAALLTLVLLVDLASIGTSARAIDRLSSRIELIAERNDTLSSQLSYSAGDISVCTEAIKLNLIAANGAATVQLTVPQGATMTFASSAELSAGQAADYRIASNVGD